MPGAPSSLLGLYYFWPRNFYFWLRPFYFSLGPWTFFLVAGTFFFVVDGDDDVRCKALMVLGRLATSSLEPYVETILQRLGDDNAAARYRALAVLFWLGSGWDVFLFWLGRFSFLAGTFFCGLVLSTFGLVRTSNLSFPRPSILDPRTLTQAPSFPLPSPFIVTSIIICSALGVAIIIIIITIITIILSRFAFLTRRLRSPPAP